MARSNKTIIAQSLSGLIGKELVFKQYGDKTIISSTPDMSGIKPSKAQKKERSKFKEAMAWAKVQMQNPDTKPRQK